MKTLRWFTFLVLVSLFVSFFSLSMPDRVLAQTEDEVVISEFVVNPTSGKEYVELLVTKPGGINMQGWTISDVGTRGGSTSGTEGDITLPSSAAYLANVPQGTYVVIVLSTPSTNSNTIPEDLNTDDGNNKLVLIVGTTAGLTTAGTMDISTSENIQLYAGTRASGTLIDQVLAGNNTSYISGADWGDNNGTTTNDNINGGTTMASNSCAYFVPSSNTLAEFQNNDTGGKFTVVTSCYGTPGEVNTDVNDTAVSHRTYDSINMNGQLELANGEWHPYARLGTGSSGVQYYLTWDATWIYVGMIGGDIGSDNYNVLIDIDPDDVGEANSGTISEYCGATFGADGKPDYALQKHSSGVAKSEASSGIWVTWNPAGDTNAASTDQGIADHVEFKIQRSDIGNPTGPIALYLYTCNNASRIWSSWPATNPQTYTGNVEELPTAIYIPALSDGKFPRYYTQWRGDQTKFNANGSFSLLNGFVQVNITSGGGTGCHFRVDLKANAPADTDNSAVRRVYTLTPDGCAPTADITLKYIDGTEGWGAVNELNGHTESSLKLWRWNGSAWVDEGGTVDTGANTVTKTGVSTFSPWTFGSTQPTATTVTRVQARTAAWPFAAGALLLLGAALLLRKQ